LTDGPKQLEKKKRITRLLTEVILPVITGSVKMNKSKGLYGRLRGCSPPCPLLQSWDANNVLELAKLIPLNRQQKGARKYAPTLKKGVRGQEGSYFLNAQV